MEQYVLESQIIHRPIQIDTSNTFEKKMAAQEKITKQEALNGRWILQGRGHIANTKSGVQMMAETRYENWPKEYPQDGDYVNFGYTKAVLRDICADWTKFTQLKMTITNHCKNIVSAALTVSLKNDGTIKIPDRYDREGYHVINLSSGTNEYLLDFSSLPRDYITEIAFSIGSNGSYLNLPGKLDVTVENITLQTNMHAASAKGWQMDKNQLVYSHIGYTLMQHKEAIISPDFVGSSFTLLDSTTKRTCYEAKVALVENEIGKFGILDFSSVTIPGTYQIQVGTLESNMFPIGTVDELTEDSIWKSLNFIFCERCGCPVPGIHGTCHQDVTAMFDEERILFNGGWHDAGDLSQQLVQTTEVTLSLFLAAKEEQDSLLAERLREEGAWGIDFILKTRLRDGFRVTSAGVTRWTDNRIGNMDDASARVHNSPYDNFLITGCLAKILVTLPNDHYLIPILLSVVEEDYLNAKIGFLKNPFVHEPIFWEHTYNTSKSLYLATIIWTASLMMQITEEEMYLEDIHEFLPQLLECQEQKGIMLSTGDVLKGFFYRDEQKNVIQHFNHQSREHLYAQALAEASVVLKGKQSEDVHQAAEFYGSYFKYLAAACSPYPMLASGIYHREEWMDEESFNRQHLLVGPSAKQEYLAQIESGKQISDEYYLKKFPVWFSFRGNNAIVLSMGESAATLGLLLKDEELRDIGFKQLQWIIGKNPFGQSMMYGVGYDYPQMYTVSSGEMVGEMPVGIQTFENEDAPYWPQFNNATYKEVWVGVAGKWLSLIAMLKKNKGDESL